MRHARLFAAAVATGALLALTATVAFADATPIELVLTYTPNVSNTGSKSASGIAELVMLEGEVRISSTGLAHLEDGGAYVAWLVNSKTNQFMKVGAFNPDESTATARFEDVLPEAIPNNDWNLLLVTVEAGPEPSQPSNRHSLAAVFPNPNLARPPAVLPNTGGADPDLLPLEDRPEWLASAGLAALTALAAFGSGYAIGLKRR